MFQFRILKILLFPFYVLFYLIVWIKNKLFDYQIIKSLTPNIYTITVGNLSIGGTGKTPMVEFLVECLKMNYNTAILSRGYGRKTKGFIQADENSNAKNIGDEPYQYYLKFHETVDIYVGEKRVEASYKILAGKPKTKLLLLDDAFQHRQIKAHLNIVLSNYNNLIYNDLLIPLGYLREPIDSLNRADILVITKCPKDLTATESLQIKARFQPYFISQKPLFFSKIEYNLPIQFNGNTAEIKNEIVLVSGLANSEPFYEYCNLNWKIIKSFDFPDHHHFSEADISNISKIAAQVFSLLVTEKDYVKLVGKLPKYITAYYLPINMAFLFGQENEFRTAIQTGINNFYQ